MNDSVETAIITALAEFGIRLAPGGLRSTFALSEGRIVARKFLYEGGYAVWIAAKGTISLYDDRGLVLQALPTVQRGMAA